MLTAARVGNGAARAGRAFGVADQMIGGVDPVFVGLPAVVVLFACGSDFATGTPPSGVAKSQTRKRVVVLMPFSIIGREPCTIPATKRSNHLLGSNEAMQTAQPATAERTPRAISMLAAERVYRLTLDAHFVVEMWAGGTTSRSDKSNHVSPPNALPSYDIQGCHVGIAGLDPLTVVD